MTQQPSPNNQSLLERLKQFLRKIENKEKLIAAVGGILTIVVTVVGFIHKPAVSIPPTNCSGFLVYIPAESDTVNDLESKINCYRDRIANNPKDAVAYTNLGEAERRLANIKNHRTNKRLNELEAAKKHHLTAQRLDPKAKEVKQGLELVNTEIEDLHQKKTWLKPEMLVKSVEGKVMTFNKKE
ncbi:hypothetical protein VB834_06520 [Limnoraphis robusta Tam1]|uniref:tetratricopeptide repeat protein n=1 Tax=Limnoraphis robusta TaxID=1118279 RepID=UPI002B1F8E5F|nr:hypothetical protein [Limnoraphis robusta]MEA5499835.1 hypothetical protein [Limnoraphis robusta BA-68 BA1]MEA5538683.1 hypothetical protein [Limnoraphis robusta Tam1]